MALTNSMASIKPLLSVSRSLNRAVDRCGVFSVGKTKSNGGDVGGAVTS